MIRRNPPVAGDDRPTVLVTGSGGFTGQAVVRRLAECCRVVGLDRQEPAGWPRGVAFLACDLAADRAVGEAVAELHRRVGGRLVSAVHLPGPLEAVRRLSEHLHRFRLEQIVFASTLFVHAPCRLGEAIDEQGPIEPRGACAASMLEAEQWLREHHGEVPLVVLRLAPTYDDFGHNQALVGQLQRIYERQLTAEVYPGNIHHGQPMLHHGDLADAIARVVERRADLPPETVLLLGEPETLSYDEIQRLAARHLHGHDWTTREIPKSLAKVGAWVRGRVPVGEEPFLSPETIDHADDHYALNVTRATTLLGWQPCHRLSEALPRIAAALRTEPVRWYREHGLVMPGWLEESIRVRANGSPPPAA